MTEELRKKILEIVDDGFDNFVEAAGDSEYYGVEVMGKGDMLRYIERELKKLEDE